MKQGAPEGLFVTTNARHQNVDGQNSLSPNLFLNIYSYWIVKACCLSYDKLKNGIQTSLTLSDRSTRYHHDSSSDV